MTLPWEDIVKLLLAILIGGLIGAEREYRDKAAGFRTIIFICLSATLFTLFSVRLGGASDPARIAANIVSGVGFLGAGAILRQGERVAGLTTAATIWLAAALGLGIGAGSYVLAGTATALVLLVLVVFPKFETWIDNLRETRSYEVTSPVAELGLLEELERLIATCDLQVRERRQVKSGQELVCTWRVSGAPEGHAQLAGKLLAHPQVKQFKG
ncbi:MAG TPA: MgtC/SapB family protein [Anaerolineae bacterium]|nr:MgtC/SapB family protein [Anaerolineae bacterium]